MRGAAASVIATLLAAVSHTIGGGQAPNPLLMLAVSVLLTPLAAVLVGRTVRLAGITGAVVGTTSFLNIKPTRQTVEIGGTFIHPDARSTSVNAEAKYLMLAHAFGSGMRRVELLTDARNVRSQAAIAKLGAVREGVLRRERVTWTGHVRDSVLFAVTDLDWPNVRACLEMRLA